MRTITASEANRQFSSVLGEVSKGEVFTVISRGRPAAVISLSADAAHDPKDAKKSLVSRLRAQASTAKLAAIRLIRHNFQSDWNYTIASQALS